MALLKCVKACSGCSLVDTKQVLGKCTVAGSPDAEEATHALDAACIPTPAEVSSEIPAVE
jgi:hypothetical protein